MVVKDLPVNKKEFVTTQIYPFLYENRMSGVDRFFSLLIERSKNLRLKKHQLFLYEKERCVSSCKNFNFLSLGLLSLLSTNIIKFVYAKNEPSPKIHSIGYA
ncbi:MAG: hypothetical protein KR126chlam3_00341 [Chlamydiae bacterium]|nr:hypothetical protein [Chlamydiota bacterium]